MPIQIHTRDGRESRVLGILEAWRSVVGPKEFNYYRDALRGLRQIAKSSDGQYTDSKGRDFAVKIRVPKLVLFILKRYIADFGEDPRDWQLVSKVAGDMFNMTTTRRSRISTHAVERDPLPSEIHHPI